MTRFLAIVAAIIFGLTAGWYGHAFVHRYDAGEDFRRGMNVGLRSRVMQFSDKGVWIPCKPHGGYIWFCREDSTAYQLDPEF